MSFAPRPVGEADIPALFAIRTAVRGNHMSPDELARAGVTPDTVAAMLRGGAAYRPAGWLGERAAGRTRRATGRVQHGARTWAICS